MGWNLAHARAWLSVTHWEYTIFRVRPHFFQMNSGSSGMGLGLKRGVDVISL